MAVSDIDKLVNAAPGEARRKNFREWAGKSRGMLATTFTDIVDSTKLAVSIGDPAMTEVREAHFARSRDLIGQNDGYEVKTIGDSVMAVFHTPENAFEYARALRQDAGHPDLLARVRAGIHIGTMDITETDAFGVTVNYAARVIHAVEGADIGASVMAVHGLAACFGKDAVERDWGEARPVEMKGIGPEGIHFYSPGLGGPGKRESGGRSHLPKGLRPGAAQLARAVPHLPAAPQNFEHEDFMSYAEGFVDPVRGGPRHRISGQVHLHEHMFVRGPKTGARIEFGVKRFFIEVTKSGPGALTAAEDLRRGVSAPRATLVQSRQRPRHSGNAVRICIDADPGTSLGARAVPAIGEDNLLPEWAMTTADVDPERLKATVLLRLEPEAVHIDGESDRKIDKRKADLIAAIVGAAARHGEKAAEGGLIRRPIKLQPRARDD